MEIHRITAEDTYPLRLLVLRPGGTLKDVQWLHDSDEGAFHLAVRDGGEIIGVGTFYPEKHKGLKGPRPFRVRGMATHPDHRGRGVGGHILRWALEEMRQAGSTLVWCNARMKAAPFYEREGFEAHGEAFELPGIGLHYVMWRRL